MLCAGFGFEGKNNQICRIIYQRKKTDMNHRTKVLAGLAATFLSGFATINTAEAVPAYPWPVKVTQPDGTSLQIRMIGDEFAHYRVDMEGHALTRDSEGRYCYALYNPDGSMHNSGYIAGSRAVPQTITSASRYIPYAAMHLRHETGKRLVAAGIESARRKSASLGTDGILRTGDGACEGRSAGSLAGKEYGEGASGRTMSGKRSLKVLIILAQYADVPYTHTQAEFNNMFHQDGYRGYGSVLEYFNDMAGDYYDFEFTVSPIVTLSKKRAYYGGNDDKNAPQAVEEACKLAGAAGIDFSRFDADNDGIVDAVSVIMAGNGEEAGAGDDCIWSYQSALDADGINLSLNGKKISGYNVCCECRGTGKTINGIGVFCHEFSHNLGLMDIYDTDYEESGGDYSPGWMMTSVMAQGSYAYSGDCPVGYGAIDYYSLGLGTRTEVTSAGSKTIGPVSGAGHPYMSFTTDVDDEVFLIEYRKAEGWDRYFSKMNYGLGVYHIDQSKNYTGDGYTAADRWIADIVNANPQHPCADMITFTSGSTPTPFFPTRNINYLNSELNSKYKTWSGKDPDYRLANIVLNSESASFNILGGSAAKPRIPSITEVEVFQDAAIISWTCSDASYDGPAYFRTESSGSEEEIEVNAYEPGKYAILLDKLNPLSSISYTIFFKDQDGNEERKISDKFKTKAEAPGARVYIILPSKSRRSDGTFSKSSAFPLRVANAVGAKTVSWTFNGSPVSTDASCYWKPAGGGILKAKVTEVDGSSVDVIKIITLK